MKKTKRKDKILLFIQRLKYIFSLLADLKIFIIIICMILSILNVLLSYISMINTQEIINYIQLNIANKMIGKRLGVFLLLSLLSIIINSVYNFLLSKYKEYLYLGLNEKFLKETLKFDMQDFENPQIYDIIQRAEQEIGIRPFSIITSALTIISQIINLISAFFILMLWHPSLILGFVLLSCIAAKYFTSISKNEYKVLMNRTNHERKSWYIAHLLIKDEYIKEVKLFNLSNYLIQQFSVLRQKFFDENIMILKKQTTFSGIYQVANCIVTFIIVCLAIYESSMGILLVGTTITYINTTSKIESAIQNLVSSFFNMYKDSLYLENIEVFFKLQPTNKDGFKEIKEIFSIKFKNVSFRYPNRQEYALKDINFEVKRGEILAIVGENGSGKTSLIKLINGLYDDYEGSITINDIEIRDIKKESLRNCLATLFQDYNKYQFTVKDNIGFGSISELTRLDKIIKSSKKAAAADFISHLPEQYDQQVGYWFDGGTQLSGGQWQKLGLSRLFMKNSDCMILDEPTASLDPLSEFEIFKQLYDNNSNKINIIITHRFINVNFATKILVLEKGEIVEEGSHNELLSNEGIYTKMYKIQSEGIVLK
ncbi:ABC transporter ATP-binding protein [Candidatus Stoquefichus massiliensis]|uniref:ABC transporter ATP-binding protein n=1 Tax=Candidatus Stoquefichus massiliensis TaxID=1470350 RepID=UPI000483CDCC|nr:ABC transporter ATP-binding protein [Candidatus Stoquefichus massiliensis]